MGRKEQKAVEKRKPAMKEMRCRNKLCVHVNISGWWLRAELRVDRLLLGLRDVLTTQCMPACHCLTLGINKLTCPYLRVRIND